MALFSMYFTHSFSNAVLKSPTDFHCQVGYRYAGRPPEIDRSIQLSRHQQFTHVGQVLLDLIAQLDLYVFPTLLGGTHHYGQLHQEPPSSYYQDFPTKPKLDHFRRDLVDGCLASHKALPSTYLEIQTYINQVTTTLIGADKVKYIWTLKLSPSKPDRYYAIDVWAELIYDMAESLALFMGFLKRDPNRLGQTCIPAHIVLWVDTGNNTRARFRVHRLDRRHGSIMNED